ncbi:MAG: ABC transporter substrate-binding protein, partial [Halobacteriales archaeon]
MVTEHITRRRALQAIGAAGLAGAAGCLGGGGTETGTGTDAVSGTVSIGALQPLSGDLEYYGNQGLWGFLSGLAYRADDDPPAEVSTGTTTFSVGEVDYELHVRDTKFTADEAQSLATDLVEDEGVDLLYGASSSGAARRIITNV